MIAEDQRNVHRKFARLVAREDVVEAVAFLGDKHCEAFALASEVQLPAHLVALAEDAASGVDISNGEFSAAAPVRSRRW